MIDINELKTILSSDKGWFEPDMESGEYILDNQLTRFAHIVVRVCTGIKKDGSSQKLMKVFAVNLRSKKGWIKSYKINPNNWKIDLLNTCRKVWREAVGRAIKDKEIVILKEEWEKIKNQK